MLQRYKQFFKKDKGLEIQSFMEGLQLNNAFRKYAGKQYYYLNGKQCLKENISYEFKDKGGMIVFSTVVNAILDKSTFIKKIKAFFKGNALSIWNRLRHVSKLDNVIKKYDEVVAYSIGNFFRGRYYDRQKDITFNEKSLSIEIIGITPEILRSIAEDLVHEFNQKEILVKEYDTGRIYLVDGVK